MRSKKIIQRALFFHIIKYKNYKRKVYVYVFVI